jgi:hypothetical protein
MCGVSAEISHTIPIDKPTACAEDTGFFSPCRAALLVAKSTARIAPQLKMGNAGKHREANPTAAAESHCSEFEAAPTALLLHNTEAAITLHAVCYCTNN